MYSTVTTAESCKSEVTSDCLDTGRINAIRTECGIGRTRRKRWRRKWRGKVITDADRNFEALIHFHKAVAVAILGLDELPPEHRTSEGFLQVLDELLSEIPKAPYVPGFPDMDPPELYERVQAFRRNLDVALDQARRAKGRSQDN